MACKEVEKYDSFNNTELVPLEQCFATELTCTICYELFIDANILNCGHSFCYLCIALWQTSNNLNKKLCPICRKTIKHYSKQLIFEKLVDAILAKTSFGECEQRNQMVNERRNQYKIYQNKFIIRKIRKDAKNMTYLMRMVRDINNLYYENDSDNTSHESSSNNRNDDFAISSSESSWESFEEEMV